MCSSLKGAGLCDHGMQRTGSTWSLHRAHAHSQLLGSPSWAALLPGGHALSSSIRQRPAQLLFGRSWGDLLTSNTSPDNSKGPQVQQWCHQVSHLVRFLRSGTPTRWCLLPSCVHSSQFPSPLFSLRLWCRLRLWSRLPCSLQGRHSAIGKGCEWFGNFGFHCPPPPQAIFSISKMGQLPFFHVSCLRLRENAVSSMCKSLPHNPQTGKVFPPLFPASCPVYALVSA